MGYIVGCLLTYMDEVDAFYTMKAFLTRYEMRDLYLPKMPGLGKAFYVLLSLMKKFLPKVHTNLLNHGIVPSVYASQWFMTLFAVCFPFEVLVRIWDIYFVEGKKIVYRVALGIFKILEADILKADMDVFFKRIKQYYKEVDAE